MGLGVFDPNRGTLLLEFPVDDVLSTSFGNELNDSLNGEERTCGTAGNLVNWGRRLVSSDKFQFHWLDRKRARRAIHGTAREIRLRKSFQLYRCVQRPVAVIPRGTPCI